MPNKFKSILFILLLILATAVPTAMATVCDVDNDQDIDIKDINAITAARNQPANGPGDPRDANGDGTITVNDGRQCVLKCTLARCAEVDQRNVDNDKDRFTENQGDCDDTNAAINPDAEDIIDNGIDEDCDGEDAQPPPPPADVPLIDAYPNPLDLGEVIVDQYTSATFTIENTGEAVLEINNIACDQPAFTIILPWPNALQPGQAAEIGVVFHPTSAGPFQGTIPIDSNADNGESFQIQVIGSGIQPAAEQVPDIDTQNRIDFGCVAETIMNEQLLTVRNTGTATLNINTLTAENGLFMARPVPGDSLPLVIEPGQTRNVEVRFTPPAGSAGGEFAGTLRIGSNDPDEALRTVQLAACATDPRPPVEQNPIAGASVADIITTANCANVSGQVAFTAGSSSANTFQVTLTDQAGHHAAGAWIAAPEGAAAVAFNGIDACDLSDGVITVSVVYRHDGQEMAPFIGTPAVKNTSSLQPPILEPIPPVTSLLTVEVCGTSRENTTVRIEGGAHTVTTTLDAGTTHFCLDVPLRPNTQNTLIASAIDDLATAPKPVAYAQPVDIVQLDPSQVVIASVDVRELNEFEIAELVANGVIDLYDPANFHVSMFTIVLTIGSTPMTISQPVVLPRDGGECCHVYYGGGGSVWYPLPGGGGGGGGEIARPGQSGPGAQLIVITTPSGQTIPGVIIIDGRIKTLKEFFQAKLLLFNNSEAFVLRDMQATIDLPPGLTPMGAALGADVGLVNTQGLKDRVFIGDIGPGQTGVGQFIFRGDAMGVHTIRLDFSGSITEGGLPAPVPVNGAVSTTVEVQGPPHLQVVVRHPSNPNGPDVTLNQIYDLIVEITNLSSRPALYTSLELFVGGSARLVDQNGDPIAASDVVRTIGTIPSGRTARLAYRVQSLAEGEIIACQAIASENITLSVDTGPGGAPCDINNMYPAAFVPLPEDMPPTVIGINPLNGQPNIPVTTSIVAVLTPRTGCLTADTWTDVVTRSIGGNPANGLEVVSATLASSGTFYLEELNAFGEPVGHVPTDLVVENPPAGGTTIAVLRLGLNAPLSQAFLKPNTRYRATLVGGEGGLCSAASGATMPETFSWIFSTAQDCTITGSFTLQSSTPPDGAANVPVNRTIELNFSNRIDLSSLRFVPGDLAASTFGVYQGDIASGTIVPGTLTLGNLNTRMIYTPSSNLPPDAQIFVRLTEGITDTCGQRLQAAGGVQLIRYGTQPAETENQAPVANAGLDQPAVPVGTMVQLNGSGSSDADGDTLSFQWAWISRPTGSNAVLSNAATATPSFIADRPGSYTVRLVVNDGQLSSIAHEVVITTSNTTPTANAGPDQTVHIGATVQLNGGNSSDPDGDALTYRWTLVCSGGTPDLIEPYTATPSFVMDHAGNCTATLIVNDGTVDSAPDPVAISTENSRPAANAGPDQTDVIVGTTVQLNGSVSSDDDGDALTYRWTLVCSSGFTPELNNPETPTPTFVMPDTDTCTATLIVNDGRMDSAADPVTITAAAITPPEPPSMNYNDVLSGEISAAGEVDQYTFEGTADDHILVTLLDSSGTLYSNPYVYAVGILYAPSGEAVGAAFGAGSTAEFALPATGTYVFRIWASDLVSAGGYRIGLERLRPATDIDDTLHYNEVLTGTIDGPAEVDLVNFEGTADDHILVTLLDSSGTLYSNPYVYAVGILYAPSGEAVGAAFGAGSTAEFALPATGTYVFRIWASDLVSAGGYWIGLERLRPATDIDDTLHYNEVLTSTIDGPAEVDLVNFEGTAGDQILVTLLDSDGTLSSNPYVYAVGILYAPSGEAVGAAFGAGSTAEFALPATGTYVFRIWASDLVSTGGYRIGLERLRPATDIDDTLHYNEVLTGTIDGPAEVDLVNFEGTAGDQILVTLLDSDGTLSSNPYVYAVGILYAPSGEAVGAAFGAGSTAEFALPATGTYVFRIWASDLVSAGGYQIGLERLRPATDIDATLHYNEVLTGTIDGPAEVDLVNFEGTAGDQILVTLLDSSGTLYSNPYVYAVGILYAPSGEAVGAAFGAGSTAEFALPATGTYVFRIWASDLVSAGGYQIGLERLRPATDIDATLHYNEVLTGTIDGPAEVDLVNFEGTAGDQILVTLLDSSGTLYSNPYVYAVGILYAPSGEAVGAAFGAGSTAEFALPATGTYVFRIWASDLVSAGGYQIGLELQ